MFFAAAFSLFAACQASPVEERERELWKAHMRTYLEQSLWKGESAYDAGAVLMVPAQAAFQFGEAAWQTDLGSFFTRVVADKKGLAPTALYRLQFLFMASRVVLAAQKAGKLDKLPPGLPGLLVDEVLAYWERRPAWQWNRSDFPSMKDRVQWKLDQTGTNPSYLRAIVDDELFVFGIAANMVAAMDAGAKADRRANLERIVEQAHRVFSIRGSTTTAGGWVFDAGVWSDEPDHAYAGVRSKEAARGPRKVSGLVRDSSHAHRWPVVLRSLVAGGGAARRASFQAMLDGLQRQFVAKVLVAPSPDFPAYRMANYMDGGNGLFAYDPGSGHGYGPYELSGTLTLGWWSAVGGDRVKSAYAEIAKSFPLPPKVIRLYATSFYPEDAAAKTPDSYVGLRPLICSLAAKLDWSK